MIALAALVPVSVRVPAAPPATHFVAHEIATGLRGGYQVVAADFNRDGKPDLLTVASGLTELTWYENPSWTPHVIASGVTAPINVAVADLDRDGIPEVALAHGFSTNPAESQGIVTIYSHSVRTSDLWTAREIDRVPSAHRLRWFMAPSGERWLINSPLAAATAVPPDYAGATPVYFYRPPAWTRERLTTEERGVVHALEPLRWSDTSPPALYTAGFAGINSYQFATNSWTRTAITAGNPAAAPNGGSSDVALGHTAGERFIAAIEPWHGNQVTVYRARGAAWIRQVIDTAVVDGHTLVVADVDRDGRDEIVVGQRGGTRSVWIYAFDPRTATWTRSTLDAGGMAAAGCTAVDLNADGRVDIACIGTATANLKWYENTTVTTDRS